MTGPIYLDGFATLPLAREAREAMLVAWERPGNAASSNVSGEHAASIVTEGRAHVADLIGATPNEIVFTSGATESNNLALLGAVSAARRIMRGRRRILISAVEHKAVMEPARRLETQGFVLTIAPVDSNGQLDLDAYKALVGKDLLLASVMMVNNETGVIQPVAEAAEVAHQAGALFHSDAAQAAGKIAIDVIGLDVDYLSLSAHKCYGPVGIGALYTSAGVPRPEPLMFGGGQQDAVRAGTEPAPLIAGFGAAAALARARLDEDQAHGRALIEHLFAEFGRRQLRFRTITGDAAVVAGSAAIALPGVDADMLCTAAARNVSLSTGSACTAGQITQSHVLEAIGLSSDEARSVVRVYCNRYNDFSEMEKAASHIVSAAERSFLATGGLHQ